MLELWQTEWCPASRRVRQRLTELGLDCSSGRCRAEPAEAVAHRAKAEKARRRYLDEECECLQPATH